MLILRKPWDSQPQDVTGSAEGPLPHPSYLWSAFSPRVLADNNLPVAVGDNVGFGVDAPGLCAIPSAVSTGFVAIGANTDFHPSGPFALACLMRRVGTAVSIFAGTRTGSTAGTHGFEFIAFTSAGLSVRAGNGSAQTSSAASVVDGQLVLAMLGRNADDTLWFNVNGVEISFGGATVSGTISGGQPLCLSRRGSSYYDNAKHFGTAYWDGVSLSIEQRALLAQNFWQLFAPRRIWVPVSAGGATTHDTTGALTGAGSTVAGTAAHVAKHSTSGALAGPGSSIAGASARTRAHPTSGALTGPGSAIAGTAAHVVPGGTHDTTGALTGPGASIAGTAAHIAKHSTSGALAGQGAAVSGTAARVAAAVTHDTSGVLTGPGAVISGQARGPEPDPQIIGGGGYPMPRRRTKKELDDERRRLGILPPEVVEEVAAAPVARRRITLQDLIGKRAAAEITNVDLSQAIAASKKRKRQRDDELLLLM